MNWFVRSSVVAALALTVGSSLAAEKYSFDRQFEGTVKVRFKETPQGDLYLHIYKPEGWKASDSRPAIVFFFGGGWNGGSPSQFEHHSRYLADRGMIAICAEYRVKKYHDTPPSACVEDGKSAIRWVRAHAKAYGIDPDRLGAGGGSAGGHVAAATGTTKGFEAEGENLSVSSKPAALVLFNPVYNNGPGQYGHDRVEAYWQQISPAHNLSKDTPPTIVFFGTEDPLVKPETARLYQKEMRQHGVKSELFLYQGQPHGFFNYGKSKNEYFIKTVTEMDKFLESLGWLKGKPSVEAFLHDS